MLNKIITQKTKNVSCNFFMLICELFFFEFNLKKNKKIYINALYLFNKFILPEIMCKFDAYLLFAYSALYLQIIFESKHLVVITARCLLFDYLFTFIIHSFCLFFACINCLLLLFTVIKIVCTPVKSRNLFVLSFLFVGH